MNISKHSNSASAPFGGGSRAFYTRAAWSRIAGAVAVLFYRTSINLFFFFLLLPSSASSTTLTNSLVLFNFWLNDGWSAIHKPLLLLHTHFLLYICIDRLRFTYVFLFLFFFNVWMVGTLLLPAIKSHIIRFVYSMSLSRISPPFFKFYVRAKCEPLH